MPKSIIVAHDLPPYFLVFKADFRKKHWPGHVPTKDIGYFSDEYVVALVDRKIGNKIKQGLARRRDDFDKTVNSAREHMKSSIASLFEDLGVPA